MKLREVSQFTGALRAGGFPESIINMATSTNAGRRRPSPAKRCIRLVLPFCDAWWFSRIATILKRGLDGIVEASVAWRLSAPHTVSIIRGTSLEYHAKDWLSYHIIARRGEGGGGGYLL